MNITVYQYYQCIVESKMLGNNNFKGESDVNGV